MAFYELMSLFQPGLKHQVAEQELKRHELVVPGDSADGWDVDLDAGTAVRTGSDTPADGGGPEPAAP